VFHLVEFSPDAREGIYHLRPLIDRHVAGQIERQFLQPLLNHLTGERLFLGLGIDR
jgi:hypothetical protein